MLLLVGRNPALLEGLAQTLAGLGDRISVAHSLAEARDQGLDSERLFVLCERWLLLDDAGLDFARRVGRPGGAIVTYRESPDEGAGALVPEINRMVLADLTLPLERVRLLSLATHTLARANAVGRRDPDPRRDATA